MELVTGRFVATSRLIGMDAPPYRLRLKLASAPAGAGSLYAQIGVNDPLGSLIEWIAATGPRRMEFGSRNVQRFDYAPIPTLWRRLFDGVQTDVMAIEADGSATVTVSGSRDAVRSFATRVTEVEGLVQVDRVTPSAPRGTLLTVGQEQALRAAVEAGYYKIPRPLNLHQLAQRFGVTAASLSERLRRAEGRILTHYIVAGLRTPDEASPAVSIDDGAWEEGMEDAES